MSDTEPVGAYVVHAVEIEGHLWVQHPNDLGVWCCRRCGMPWLVHPDQNPERQLQTDSQMMPWCQKVKR